MNPVIAFEASGRNEPQLEDLSLLVPSRTAARLNACLTFCEVRPNDSSFLTRLVQRPFEIRDLRNAFIIQEELTLAGWNRKGGCRRDRDILVYERQKNRQAET